MTGVRVGYARTSTAEQVAGLEDQLRILKEMGCERIFSEHASAKTDDRPQLNAMLTYVREGDTLIVTKLDRIARSASHMLKIVDTLSNKGVHVNIMNIGDTSTISGKLMLTIMAAIAEAERETMLERQKVGLAKAKKEGKFMGRKPALNAREIVWAQEQFEMRKSDPQMGLSIKQLCERFGVARTTMHNALHGKVKARPMVKGKAK